ncbi:MAG: siroheme synthase [Deinococcus sp.]|nr:siroheme synthase [Deinococcus sp.]
MQPVRAKGARGCLCRLSQREESRETVGKGRSARVLKAVVISFLTVRSGTPAPVLNAILHGVSLLPVFLDLRGESALVVGGGVVALRRAMTLLEAGLNVTVVAPSLHPDLEALPVRAERRTYLSSDVQGQRVVVAATDSPTVNAAVSGDARAAGALVNHAGDAQQGSLRFAATTAKAGVQVAVSSGRELPMLTQALTERIAALLPSEEQLDSWTAYREEALRLEPEAKAAALAQLRTDIRAALGLAALALAESSRRPVGANPLEALGLNSLSQDTFSGGTA